MVRGKADRRRVGKVEIGVGRTRTRARPLVVVVVVLLQGSRWRDLVF